MLRFLKFDKKTGKHVHVKKPVHPNDETTIDFMLHSPNDKSEVANSPLLVIQKAEMKKCPSINNITTNVEFELVEILLREAIIEGYSLSYPSENFPDKFLLSHVSSLYCLICDQEHDSDNAYII